MVLPREEYTNWLSNTKWPALKLYACKLHYTDRGYIQEYMYVCICMWQQLMEKGGHEFEWERGEYKEVYGEKKKEEKVSTYNLRNKRKSFGKGATVKEMMKMPSTDHTYKV